MSFVCVVLPLLECVHCRSEVLWRYPTRACNIGGIDCLVCVPGANIWPGDLKPPVHGYGQKAEDWPIAQWGTVNSSDNYNVTIEAVGLRILNRVPSSDDELIQFEEALGRWNRLLRDWLAVMAEGPTTFLSPESASTIWGLEGDNRLAHARYSRGDVWEPQAVSWWQWDHAFWHAVQGDSPPLSRKFLTFAMRAAAEGDGRGAVIHAATAAECALTSGLTRHLSVGHPPVVVQKWMNKHKMLGGRLGLAQKIGITVPGDTRKSLLEPRNAAMHEGQEITAADGWRAVTVATAIVNDLEPLPEHCEEPIQRSNEIQRF